MEISERGIEFIAGFEGGQSSDGLYRAYWDSYGGVYTIGIGETHGVHAGMVWTKAHAYADFKHQMAANYEPSIAALGVPLNQNQWDALCSFVWNLGPGSMKWDVGRLLRARDYRGAANAMLQYDRAGGVVLAGLQRRRRAEHDLFLTPVHVDPYAIFDTTPRLSSSVSKKPLSECQAVMDYDQWIKHPHIDHAKLAQIRIALVWFRKRVWYLAHFDPKTGDKRPEPIWNENNFGARWHELNARTK